MILFKHHVNDMPLVLVFDTETTGFPSERNAAPEHIAAYDGARLLSIAWSVIDTEDPHRPLSQHYSLINADVVRATEIHGITKEQVDMFGDRIENVLTRFMFDLAKVETLVAHNIQFDVSILASEMFRLGVTNEAEALLSKPTHCTKLLGTPICKLVSFRKTMYKWPKLDELYEHLFHESFPNAHHALCDVYATVKCYIELINYSES